jgi:hypothetical protein
MRPGGARPACAGRRHAPVQHRPAQAVAAGGRLHRRAGRGRALQFSRGRVGGQGGHDRSGGPVQRAPAAPRRARPTARGPSRARGADCAGAGRARAPARGELGRRTRCGWFTRRWCRLTLMHAFIHSFILTASGLHLVNVLANERLRLLLLLLFLHSHPPLSFTPPAPPYPRLTLFRTAFESSADTDALGNLMS